MRIGDIIICLPIAKYYKEQGYDIIWPILKPYINMFKRHVDYVDFLPIEPSWHMCVHDSRVAVKEHQKLELIFHYPQTQQLTQQYTQQDLWSFDEFKYKLSNVPFDLKWKLDIKRDYDRELDLYNKLIKNPDYVVYQKKSSDCQSDVVLNLNGKPYDIIELNEYTDDIFDWLTILERAKKLVLIESCFSNLVDQLQIKTDKVLITKTGYYDAKLQDGTHKGMPRLRGNWEII
jgi:hypothetical protein